MCRGMIIRCTTKRLITNTDENCFTDNWNTSSAIRGSYTIFQTKASRPGSSCVHTMPAAAHHLRIWSCRIDSETSGLPMNGLQTSCKVSNWSLQCRYADVMPTGFSSLGARPRLLRTHHPHQPLKSSRIPRDKNSCSSDGFLQNIECANCGL